MQQFSINKLVLTTLTNLEEIRDEFISVPDSEWMNGKGKEALYDGLAKAVLDDDRFFNDHPEMIWNSRKKWNSFLDDCLVLAVLDSILNSRQLKLMNPSVFENNLFDTEWDMNGSDNLKLIGAIPESFEETGIAKSLSELI